MNLENIKGVIKNVMTEVDGESFDFIRFAAGISILAMIALQATLKEFQPLAFGGGVAAILAAVVGKDRWGAPPDNSSNVAGA